MLTPDEWQALQLSAKVAFWATLVCLPIGTLTSQHFANFYLGWFDRFVKETLGDAWLNSSRYRFGASSLLNDLLRQIAKEKTGAYQAPYYFTEAAESY